VLFTLPGYLAAVCPRGPGQAACETTTRMNGDGGILVSVVPGPRGQAAVDHLVAEYPSFVTLAGPPTSLVNFGEAVNFPLIFGGILAVFGAATLLHLLLVSVARRRREIGLLKVLGFVNHQVASTVAWQATTLALVGIVVGIPLGVAAGGAVWRAFATRLGVIAVSVVPVWLMVAVGVGVVVVANLLAVVPALAATRSKPGVLLRDQ
jgi:hypothetical protein